MTSSGYASPNSIMVQLQNNTGATVTNLAVAFDIKHYRINTAAASVSFFYSLDGSAWTAATAGDVTLIASFVINGTAPQRVLVRGIGPTLAAFAVAGALPNPTLTLSRGATTVKTNDDWFRDPDAALINATAVKVGAFPLPAQSPDASMLLYLDPGAYTAQVTASGNTTGTGIALVEIYEVP
jgi:hypothetical protein